MTMVTLTPISLQGDISSPLNLSSALAASPLGSYTGVAFPTSGREILVVQTTAASTVISQIGATVEGQSVPGVRANLPSTGIAVLGAWPSRYNEPGGLIRIDFGTPASISGVVVLQVPGVH